MWGFWSLLIIISLPLLKDSLLIKAKLASSTLHQFPTNQFMPHYSTSSARYHKNSKTSLKIFLHKTNLMKATSFYYFSKPTISTNGNKKLNTNIHGTQKDQCCFIWSNWPLHNCRIGTRVSIWPTGYLLRTMTKCKHLTQDTNCTRTSSKQQSMEPQCLLTAKSHLSIHCKRRRNKFTFTTRFSSPSPTKLLTTTANKRVNKQPHHHQLSIQTWLIYKCWTTWTLRDSMFCIWSSLTIEGIRLLRSA